MHKLSEISLPSGLNGRYHLTRKQHVTQLSHTETCNRGHRIRRQHPFGIGPTASRRRLRTYLFHVTPPRQQAKQTLPRNICHKAAQHPAHFSWQGSSSRRICQTCRPHAVGQVQWRTTRARNCRLSLMFTTADEMVPACSSTF